MNRSIVPIVKPDFMPLLVMVLARNVRLVSIKMTRHKRIAKHARKERTTKIKVPRVIRSVGNVHKGDTRQQQESQTLLIATRVPLERRTRTMVPQVARRVSTVVSTPKQRRQVRLNV